MKVHYICHYDDYQNSRNLLTQPSGVTKINYIKQSLVNANYRVCIFSVSEVKEIYGNLNLYKNVVVNKYESIVYPLTFGRGNLLLKYLSRLLISFQLLFYLFIKIKKDDKVLIYHSLSLVNIINLYRFLGGKVYFEVEEIYNAVKRSNSQKIHKEIEYLRDAKGYILVNDIMKRKCAFKALTVSCYGVYDYRIKTHITDSYKIHIVYAGVIASKGSDAYLCVEVAKYLSSKYVIHILGYGSELNITFLKDVINKHNKNFECKVQYEGCLFGKPYLDFLSRCQIGLCTRVLEDCFSDYTFPSKVCVYLANQLIPICTPISCIKESKIKDAVYFSKDNTAESIAYIIKKVDLLKYKEYKELLGNLDNEFVYNLKKLFSL